METEKVVAAVANERLVIRARELRGDRTLSEIAARAGIRQDDLGRIERGETQGIRYETLLKLCTALKVTPHELFKVESTVTRRGNPLDRVLAGIKAGTVQTHGIAPKVRKLQPLGPTTDSEFSAAEFSEVEEPTVPRRRTRVPASVMK